MRKSLLLRQRQAAAPNSRGMYGKIPCFIPRCLSGQRKQASSTSKKPLFHRHFGRNKGFFHANYACQILFLLILLLKFVTIFPFCALPLPVFCSATDTTALRRYGFVRPSLRLYLLTRLMCLSKSPFAISSAKTNWIKVGTVQE